MVGPICEFTFQPQHGSDVPEDAKYEIKIPHIIQDKDINRVKRHLKVRHGDMCGDDFEDKENSETGEHNACEIDEKSLTVSTTYCSTYIVTVEYFKGILEIDTNIALGYQVMVVENSKKKMREISRHLLQK